MKASSKRPATPSTHRHYVVISVLCLVTFVAYWNSFSAGLVFDSARLLREDPRVHEVSAENVGLILQHTYWWPSFESRTYRPLGTISYLFNSAMLGNGEQPEDYHWINLLLHIGNVLLVYALMRRLFPAFWPPVFVAGLWAVHPILTESVTNIAGRVRPDGRNGRAERVSFLSQEHRSTRSATLVVARRANGGDISGRFLEGKRSCGSGTHRSLRTCMVEEPTLSSIGRFMRSSGVMLFRLQSAPLDTSCDATK
jgi:hypothetical protein